MMEKPPHLRFCCEMIWLTRGGDGVSALHTSFLSLPSASILSLGPAVGPAGCLEFSWAPVGHLLQVLQLTGLAITSPEGRFLHSVECHTNLRI